MTGVDWDDASIPPMEPQEVTEMVMKKNFIITDIEEVSTEELLTHPGKAIRDCGQLRLLVLSAV